MSITQQKIALIKVPNPLKERVPYDENGVDLEQLKKAEEAVEAMTETYLSWVANDMVKIKEAYQIVIQKGEWQNDDIVEFFRLVHDMKGQGGTFGYNLLSLIGDKLCRFIELSTNKDKMSELDMQVISLHIQALEVVLKNDLKSDGGEEGAMLLKGLEDVLQKALNA